MSIRIVTDATTRIATTNIITNYSHLLNDTTVSPLIISATAESNTDNYLRYFGDYYYCSNDYCRHSITAPTTTVSAALLLRRIMLVRYH